MMAFELDDLNTDILVYTYELQDLSRTIQDLDADLIKNATPEDQIFMNETLERYKDICNKLRITLEAFFAEEKRLNLPTYITFRKLYKSLKKT